jgi:hypothetical protein
LRQKIPLTADYRHRIADFPLSTQDESAHNSPPTRPRERKNQRFPWHNSANTGKLTGKLGGDGTNGNSATNKSFVGFAMNMKIGVDFA